MTFGLTNTPVAFMGLMKQILREYVDRFVIMFIDEVLIYSINEEKNADHHRTILKAHKDRKFYGNFLMCEFWLTSVAFLGYIAFEEGI